jgi:RecB family exonuclease
MQPPGEIIVHEPDLWHNNPSTMNAIILPYGHAARTERARFVERILAGRPDPPYLYNDVLVLVPVSRLRRLYGRLFVDTLERRFGASALVPPSVQTFHQFWSGLYAGLDAVPVLDEISRLVLLEDIVRDCMAGSASFGARPEILAPSLSAATAAMIEELRAAGISPDQLSSAVLAGDFHDKPQVKLLLDAFVRYTTILQERRVTDPPGMLAWLAEHYDPAWLASFIHIVVDNVISAEGPELQLLIRITGHPGCSLLVEAPSPERITEADEHHPLSLLRRALKRMNIAPQAGDAVAPEEDRFLSTALFSDRSFDETAHAARQLPSFAKDLRVLSAVTMREEVTLIAAEVKKSLRRGTPPDNVLVTFPALDAYGPLLEEIFGDYGIPFNRALGRQLSASAVTAAVISLLRVVQEDCSVPSLLRVLSSPFLPFGSRPQLAAALDRIARQQRVIGGRRKLIAATRAAGSGVHDAAELIGRLEAFFSEIDPLSAAGRHPLSYWMQALDAVLRWSGMAERVAAIKGPLNINLQAYTKLTETLAALNSAGRLFPSYQCTFGEWAFVLRKTLLHVRFQVPPEDEGGVQILGLGESTGQDWTEVFIGGLVDAQFPQRLPQNIFLPEDFLDALGVRAGDRSRMTAAGHFYRLVLSAPRVTLTRPEQEGDHPVTPSPFLMELEPLRRAGLINRGIEKTSALQFSLSLAESRSAPEFAKAVSRTGPVAGLTDFLRSAGGPLAGIATALTECAPAKQRAQAAGGKREFSVTELDLYLRCPYDYYVGRVLGIKPLEGATEDISPLDRGSRVHEILRSFYLGWSRAITPESRGEARSLLNRLAQSVFDREADTFRNRRERELFLTVMVERFLDAEQEFWTSGMKPVYLEQAVELPRFTLADGTDVVLTGKIDRIDADERGNFLIVDYKTGGYPAPKMGTEQEIFQLPVYAVMARTQFSGKTPALTNVIGLAYYDLAGRYGAGARDVVLFDKDVRADHPAVRPKASPKTAVEFEALLERSMEKARAAIAGILAGRFPAHARSESMCRRCPNAIMCDSEASHVS